MKLNYSSGSMVLDREGVKTQLSVQLSASNGVPYPIYNSDQLVDTAEGFDLRFEPVNDDPIPLVDVIEVIASELNYPYTQAEREDLVEDILTAIEKT